MSASAAALCRVAFTMFAPATRTVGPCRARLNRPFGAGLRRAVACGFTMLELVVVLTVLGLLAGIVGPRLFMRQGQATVTAVNAQLEMLSKALDQYRFDTGHYPTPEQGLVALVLRPAGEVRWQGPYLARAVPTDPWGHAFVYRLTGPAGSPQPHLMSLGADGQEGGHNDAADIVLAPKP